MSARMTDYGRRKALGLRDQVNNSARINFIVILGCNPHPILSPLTRSVSEVRDLALRASPTPKISTRRQSSGLGALLEMKHR
jgi:hypothetical protein